MVLPWGMLDVKLVHHGASLEAEQAWVANLFQGSVSKDGNEGLVVDRDIQVWAAKNKHAA